MYVGLHVCMHIHVCMYEHGFARMHVCMCVSACVYACVYVCIVHVCTYVRLVGWLAGRLSAARRSPSAQLLCSRRLFESALGSGRRSGTVVEWSVSVSVSVCWRMCTCALVLPRCLELNSTRKHRFRVYLRHTDLLRLILNPPIAGRRHGFVDDWNLRRRRSCIRRGLPCTIVPARTQAEGGSKSKLHNPRCNHMSGMKMTGVSAAGPSFAGTF